VVILGLVPQRGQLEEIVGLVCHGCSWVHLPAGVPGFCPVCSAKRPSIRCAPRRPSRPRCRRAQGVRRRYRAQFRARGPQTTRKRCPIATQTRTSGRFVYADALTEWRRG
jgi:hypothetical protein